MNIERKRIEMWKSGEETIGHITLDKLAIPETVKVSLFGELIIPNSFDCYGHPNFTKEQAMLCLFKQEEFKRQNGGEYAELKAVISYEEGKFDVARSNFDTIKGIEQSLGSLSDLNQMLQNRRIFYRTHKNILLKEFVIFGSFLLSQCSEVMSVTKEQKSKLKTNGTVEEFETFKRNNSNILVLTTDGYAIPTADSICPCCGKAITIEDIKTNPCIHINGKFYHDNCWSNYRKLVEIDEFTRKMIGKIYKETDYQFELIPNGYWPVDYYSYIPWFLFHTIDGDIIMGNRKRVISIEWQENYAPFEMNELFEKENVTKWEINGKRGIHAWGKDKAYEYLKKVLKTVNPGYTKW